MNFKYYQRCFESLKLPIMPEVLKRYNAELYNCVYLQYCKELEIYETKMKKLKEDFKLDLFRNLKINCNTKKELFFNKLIWVYDPQSKDDFLKMYNLATDLVELII